MKQYERIQLKLLWHRDRTAALVEQGATENDASRQAFDEVIHVKDRDLQKYQAAKMAAGRGPATGNEKEKGTCDGQDKHQ